MEDGLADTTDGRGALSTLKAQEGLALMTHRHSHKVGRGCGRGPGPENRQGVCWKLLDVAQEGYNLPGLLLTKRLVP